MEIQRLYLVKGALSSLRHSSSEYLKTSGPKAEFYKGVNKVTEIIMDLIDEQIEAAEAETNDNRR